MAGNYSTRSLRMKAVRNVRRSRIPTADNCSEATWHCQVRSMGLGSELAGSSLSFHVHEVIFGVVLLQSLLELEPSHALARFYSCLA